jgi:hypothetical protein
VVLVLCWFLGKETREKTKQQNKKENKTRSNGNLAQAFCAIPYSFYSFTSQEV